MHTIRPAAVAGTFYPGNPYTLSADVNTLLKNAYATVEAHPDVFSGVPKALIVPHAGYIYSGPIAATAYAQLRSVRDKIRRVVLLGPSHRVYLNGLALAEADVFSTPLGSLAVDQHAVAELKKLPQVQDLAVAHELEHSLEVQLPFLQHLFQNFTLIPLVVGNATPEEVAEVLELLWGGEETLILISSDLSHFLSYRAACDTDRATANAILSFKTSLNGHEACGCMPINGLLNVAKKKGLQPRLLDLRNSGDTAGDKNRVVGYGALVFMRRQNMWPTDAGQVLLPVARAAIEQALGGQSSASNSVLPAWVNQEGASFVTLTQAGQLRGCIGTLEPHRSLLEDVKANAVAAATRDPRFPRLQYAELAHTDVELSVLSPIVAMPVSSEEDALAKLRPGVDGIVLEWHGHRSTFLPQVWEQLSDPVEFLGYLKRKAGLAVDFWADDLQLGRYTVSKWTESGL